MWAPPGSMVLPLHGCDGSVEICASDSTQGSVGLLPRGRSSSPSLRGQACPNLCADREGRGASRGWTDLDKSPVARLSRTVVGAAERLVVHRPRGMQPQAGLPEDRDQPTGVCT